VSRGFKKYRHNRAFPSRICCWWTWFTREGHQHRECLRCSLQEVALIKVEGHNSICSAQPNFHSWSSRLLCYASLIYRFTVGFVDIQNSTNTDYTWAEATLDTAEGWTPFIHLTYSDCLFSFCLILLKIQFNLFITLLDSTSEVNCRQLRTAEVRMTLTRNVNRC
jgi:hypothetical protein